MTRFDEYKQSGMEWLDVVPSHWTVKRVKEVCSSISQGVSPNAADWPTEAEGVGILKLSAISNGSFLPKKNKAYLDDELPSKAIFVIPGDVLISRSNTPLLVGDSCVVKDNPYANL